MPVNNAVTGPGSAGCPRTVTTALSGSGSRTCFCRWPGVLAAAGRARRAGVACGVAACRAGAAFPAYPPYRRGRAGTDRGLCATGPARVGLWHTSPASRGWEGPAPAGRFPLDRGNRRIGRRHRAGRARRGGRGSRGWRWPPRAAAGRVMPGGDAGYPAGRQGQGQGRDPRVTLMLLWRYLPGICGRAATHDHEPGLPRRETGAVKWSFEYRPRCSLSGLPVRNCRIAPVKGS